MNPMNPMSAHSIISHRMFVAALSQDENDETQKRQSSPAPATDSRGQGTPGTGASGSPGAAGHQLLLLPDTAGLESAQT